MGRVRAAVLLDAELVAGAAAMLGCAAAALSEALAAVSAVALAVSGRVVELSDLRDASRLAAESVVRAVSGPARLVSGRVGAVSARTAWLVSLRARLLVSERDALSFDASAPGAYAR